MKLYKSILIVIRIFMLCMFILPGFTNAAASSPAEVNALTFLVTNTSDKPDTNPGDGQCKTNSAGDCSLRAALQEANASPGVDRIEFCFYKTSHPTIYLSSPYPPITEALVLDGASTPSCPYTRIGLDGASAGAGTHGLQIMTSGATVRALAVYNFQGSGVYVEGNDNLVEGIFLGTNDPGDDGLGNWGNGVVVHSGNNNKIYSNIIVSNLQSGVLIEAGTGTEVMGNTIGFWGPTNQPRPNQGNGVRVWGGSGHTMGGLSNARNFISGNMQSGIYLGSNTSSNSVINNFIGTSRDGSLAIGNGVAGIEIRGSGNFVQSGGTGGFNLVSGNRLGIWITGSTAANNTVTGSRIGVNAAVTASLPNLIDGIYLTNQSGGNDINHNIIGGNQRHGVYISGSGSPAPCDQNKVNSNTIGTNSGYTIDLGNGGDGVQVNGSSCTEIKYNEVFNNAENGIVVTGDYAVASTVTGNLVENNGYTGISLENDNNIAISNRVGLNAQAGIRVVGNYNELNLNRAYGWVGDSTQDVGILVMGDHNTISGSGLSVEDIHGHSLAGVMLSGNYNTVTNYSIVDNYGNGVLIQGDYNQVGSASYSNYIDGNVDGLVISTGANNNLVTNNRIGAERYGGSAIGNATSGVTIQGSDNTIQDNSIVNTQETGLVLANGANGNQILDNRIGVLPNLTAAPNHGGILITGGASQNQISGNRIGYNIGPGILIESGTGNQVLTNDIYDNTGLGIDLSPTMVNANDSADSDTGANNMQNYPVISLVAVSASSTRIQGVLEGAPNTTYHLEAFMNDACDASGYGEAEDYLGSRDVTTDGSGLASLDITVPTTSPLGKYLTATATDPDGNTSEFSRCALGRPTGGSAPFTVNTAGDASDTNTGDGICDSNAAAGEQCSLRAAIQQANSNVGANTIILPAGTYQTTLAGGTDATGDLDVYDILTITGDGANSTIIQAGVSDRIFDIRSSSVVTITGVTIQNGNSGSSAGGGVLVNSSATLTLEAVNILSNQSSVGGGGIANLGSLVITNSAIAYNTSGSTGAGIYQSGATASLVAKNTTISDNQATGNGGGVAHAGGSADLYNVSVAYNTTAGNGGGLYFGGSGGFLLTNSVVADNDDTTHTTYQYGTPDCSGTFTAGGYNLVGDRARASNYPTTPDGCTLTGGSGNTLGGFWMMTRYLTYYGGLGPLQTNGGTTLSRSPMASAAGLAVDFGSPEIPGSSSSACDPFDQRGQPRPVDGGTDGIARCDRGAVEHIPSHLSISDATAQEGANAIFTVSLSEPAQITFTVNFSTTAINTVSGSDFSFTSGMLTFPAGATSQDVSVATLNDTYNEANETFRVRLYQPQWVFIGDGEGIGTIQDSDPLPSILVNDTSVAEGGQASFTVSLNSPSGQAVRVDYTVNTGTATPDLDFTARQGTLTFNPGVTSQIVNVTTLGDELQESSETFILTLSNPVHAAIGDPSGTGSIQDDDVPAFSIGDQTRTEDQDGASTTMVFNVTLSKVSSQTTTVVYITQAGSATSGSDYVHTSGTLTFAAGQRVQTISVTILGDGVVEPVETFTVSLSNPTGGAVVARATATGAIQPLEGYKLYLPVLKR